MVSVGAKLVIGAVTRMSAPTALPRSTLLTEAVAGKLGAKWTHVDSSQVVHEETKDITFAGDNVTDFQISKPDGWPTGKYKVEISLDGAVVQTREFEVK